MKADFTEIFFEKHKTSYLTKRSTRVSCIFVFMKNSNLNFSEFRNVSRDVWNEVATRQLKGDAPSDTLKWSSEFGLPLQVYYDADSRGDLGYLGQFFSTVSEHNWKLYERIEVIDDRSANGRVLEALNEGCGGVFFSINQIGDLDLLTKGILFEHCDVSFIVSNGMRNEVESFRNARGIQASIIDRETVWCSDRFSQSSGLANLSEMVIDFAENPKNNPKIFLRLSQDFFHELARVRAIKYLFWRVADSIGIKCDPNDIYIHCEPIGIDEKSENLFTQSTAGMAAIIGGANSVSFDPMHSTPRISRNVGNMIREESKIDSFQNAGSGSFFIDTLTDQMIRHVWSKLQERLDS